MKQRFSEEQIVRILREAEIPGVQIREVCRKNNITEIVGRRYAAWVPTHRPRCERLQRMHLTDR